MTNIHATLVSHHKKGILFIGESGMGKSDLALQMIINHKAKLVADDYVNLENKKGQLYGMAPKELYGKMEVRGIGIMPVKALKKAKIALCVELVQDRSDVERLPFEDTINFLGVSVTKIKLYPFDCSTICKIIAKINGIIN